MRKFIYTITALSTLLWSCGGGGDTLTPPPVTNNTPSIPTLTYPTANLLCIDNVINFEWNASTDSDEDAITYQLQIAKNNQFSPIAQEFNITETAQEITLDIGTAYYWRVKATDNKSASSNYSSVFSFYTEGVGITNHLPFTPVLVSPTINSVQTGTPVNLQWTASDVDTADTLTYDVYFGTANPPTVITSANQSPSSLSKTVSASTTYYWKVVVKDGKGGQTIGQVWNFVTD